MSFDAGSLARYNMNGNAIGVPTSGFASRGKAPHIKHLDLPSLAPHSSGLQAPQTAGPRAQLLSGLRTAPRSVSGFAPPPTAPLPQLRVEQPKTTPSIYSGISPLNAAGDQFSRGSQFGYQPPPQTYYSLPEHVLPPPSLDFPSDDIDENLYAELLNTNIFLAAQQQRLQQQLATVTAAAQQYQAINGLGLGNSQQLLSPGLQPQQQQQQTQQQQPAMSFYQRQAQQGLQPVVTPVPGRPNVYAVYNPMTGQQNFVVDSSAVQQEPQDTWTLHPELQQQQQQQQQQQRPAQSRSPSLSSSTRVPSPPRSNLSPPAGMSLFPSQSTNNTLRRPHRKVPSMLNCSRLNAPEVQVSGPKTAPLTISTPMTGTFGPGQARAGAHPIRQPKGPPSLEELMAKPTSKHEGSKNFATRQRRRAVYNLVRAGLERRGDPRSVHSSSAGSASPASDGEFNFSVSDAESGSSNSASLSSKPSIGSLRAYGSVGAIGSERKEHALTHRKSMYDNNVLSATTAEETLAEKLSQLRSDDLASPFGSTGRATPSSNGSERRRMPIFVLSSAEKRKGPGAM